MHLPVISSGAGDADKSVLQLCWFIRENMQGLLIACVKTVLFIVEEPQKQPGGK